MFANVTINISSIRGNDLCVGRLVSAGDVIEGSPHVVVLLAGIFPRDDSPFSHFVSRKCTLDFM
jgi:hypothetical protein